MVSTKIKMIDEIGLHMRPAKVLSQMAVEYRAGIKIRFKDNEFNAKSLISTLGAGIKCGSEIEIICDGEDEEKALNEITDYLSGRFEK